MAAGVRLPLDDPMPWWHFTPKLHADDDISLTFVRQYEREVKAAMVQMESRLYRKGRRQVIRTVEFPS